MHFAPRKLMLAAALAVVTLAACGDDDNGGTGPSVAPPANVTVTASTSTRATITFNTVSGASSYLIERASGATGTSFVTAGSVQQPASGTTVTFDDPAVLEAGATYRYRIATLRGNTSSDYSAIVNVTTKAAGSGGTVTVSGDIT
ncbi:MAG: fibronectin type III domain-containing protein, partial [Gemmatimonadaceae bacterium]